VKVGNLGKGREAPGNGGASGETKCKPAASADPNGIAGKGIEQTPLKRQSVLVRPLLTGGPGYGQRPRRRQKESAARGGETGFGNGTANPPPSAKDAARCSPAGLRGIENHRRGAEEEKRRIRAKRPRDGCKHFPGEASVTEYTAEGA